MSPSRLPTVCACGKSACTEHSKARDERPSAHRRGYDAVWKRLRLQVLAEEPLCRFCLSEGRVTPAAHVDHIETVRARPELRLVRSNLRALCAPCHNARSGRKDGSA